MTRHTSVQLPGIRDFVKQNCTRPHSEIAKELGCSVSTVYKIFRELGYGKKDLRAAIQQSRHLVQRAPAKYSNTRLHDET